jgi:hypothetical protein
MCHPPGACSLSLKSGGVAGTPGVWDFGEHGMLEHWGKLVESPNLHVPASAIIAPQGVSVDPSRVWGFGTTEVWG